jgi:arginase
MPNYVCIGVPYFVGEQIDGRDEVEVMQHSGIAAALDAPWFNVLPNFAAHDDSVVAVNHALAATIKLHEDRIPLIFAADCTSSLGVMKGLQAHTPAILWYDAHGDFNTHETTPSGFLGGMPLAMLVGKGDLRYMRGVDLHPTAERDVIITDARDLDPQEAEMLRESQVRHLEDVADLMTAALPDQPLYVHFDTDVVNTDEMPGMNYPAAGGPSLDTATATLQRVARDATVAGVLFGLWDDRHDTGGKTRDAVLRLVHDFTRAHQESENA